MKLELDRPIALDVQVNLPSALVELERKARAFVAAEVAPREHEESDDAAVAMTLAMGDAGLLDAAVDLDVPAICVLREVVASASGLCDSMLALQGLGYAPIALYGNDGQKARWREAVRSGQAIAAIGITEPEAGSDVAAIRTTARRDGEHWVLDGEKCFITNAGIADFYVIIARTGGPGSSGLSAIWVPAAEIAEVERYELVAPHPCGALKLREARVPLGNLIGQEGEGFKIAMRTLDHFRTTVGAAALGMGARALSEAVARSKSRQQFGKPISQFQQIGAQLADSWAELIGARLLVYRAAAVHCDGDPMAGLYSSAAKLTATEVAQRIIDRSVQIHGGQGVRRGSTVERLYREIRALRIYEGTSEIQRVVLSRALTA
ncbi:MAG: acyl-CoA dehydrogenase [Deltaproteobacteria bacterium]|nr:acyl-CoA dehydrogenase [Deltaproteobacteria bacterium]